MIELKVALILVLSFMLVATITCLALLVNKRMDKPEKKESIYSKMGGYKSIWDNRKNDERSKNNS